MDIEYSKCKSKNLNCSDFSLYVVILVALGLYCIHQLFHLEGLLEDGPTDWLLSKSVVLDGRILSAVF